jgi:hypothetical protein
VVVRAVEAMGGRAALAQIRSAVMTVDAEPNQIQERHTLRLEGRYLHYASRRPSGAGFDVVLAREQAFLCDRDPEGNASYVEELTPQDAQEGAYERDILFMPLLLPLLLEERARLDYRGRNSVGDDIVRALIRPPPLSSGEPFVVRLRFDHRTHLLTSTMGIVPRGVDKGKKRYCRYGDYRLVKGREVRTLLPHRISDQRGKDESSREFDVEWRLNVELSAELFLKPRPAEDSE